ncbi:MAG: hypothetical protein EHM89_18665 [Acidobacteria bacterium]|nr:MAG: hypothetical protein EHM89_18665 [Acidobacteriota bacterium]
MTPSSRVIQAGLDEARWLQASGTPGEAADAFDRARPGAAGDPPGRAFVAASHAVRQGHEEGRVMAESGRQPRPHSMPVR